jgi:hypothetical protein
MLFTIYKCSAAVSHTQQFNNFLLEHKYSRFWRFLIVGMESVRKNTEKGGTDRKGGEGIFSVSTFHRRDPGSLSPSTFRIATFAPC